MYNELNSARRQKVIKSGWERSGTLDAITLGSKKLPKLDPFADIDLLESDEIPDFPEAEEVHEEYEHDEVELFSTKVWDQNRKKMKPVMSLIFLRMTIETKKFLCYLLCYSFVNHILSFNVKD